MNKTLVRRSAVFSPSRKYRYVLHRRWGWGSSLGPAWLMLNPSTADERVDDPTITRCMGYSEAWGFDGLEILNLFGLRSPYPKDLYDEIRNGGTGVGEENDYHIRRIALKAPFVVVGWGSNGEHKLLRERVEQVQRLLWDIEVYCLGETLGGSPRHPLYLPKDAERAKYDWHSTVS